MVVLCYNPFGSPVTDISVAYIFFVSYNSKLHNYDFFVCFIKVNVTCESNNAFFMQLNKFLI